MDPTVNLTEQRNHRIELLQATSAAEGLEGTAEELAALRQVRALADHFAYHVGELDEWLSRGGFPPSPWMPPPHGTDAPPARDGEVGARTGHRIRLESEHGDRLEGYVTSDSVSWITLELDNGAKLALDLEPWRLYTYLGQRRTVGDTIVYEPLDLTGVAADQPRDPLLTPERTGEPQVDVRLFRLRDCLNALTVRYGLVGEIATTIRWLDRHLTAGGSLPMEWRPELTSAEPDDFHWLLGELRTWAREVTVMELTEDLPHLTALLDRLEVWAAEPVSCAGNSRHELALRAAFEAGTRRGIYVGIMEGLNEWTTDVPLDEDRYVATAMEWVSPESVVTHGVRRGGYFPDGGVLQECGPACSEGHTYAPGCLLGGERGAAVSGGGYPRRDDMKWTSATIDAPLPWPSDDHTVPFGDEETAAAPGESWTPTGHETTFPCRVHLRVTYRDGTDAYHPVPDGGWRIDTVRREVVIGKGLGRIHIPLDVVWSYSPEECHPGRGRIQEHEQGPTARGER